MLGFVAATGSSLVRPALADTTPLTILDPNLQATNVLNTGIIQPIGIAFIGSNDALILEKASGQVKRMTDGILQPNPVLDLAVNSNSERGLLSVVVAPDFPLDPSVYIYWTESSTGADSTQVQNVSPLGNRVGSFHLEWNQPIAS